MTSLFMFFPMWTGFHTGYAKFHQTDACMFLDVDHGLNPVTESAHLRLGGNQLLSTTPALELKSNAGRKPDSQAIFKPKESSILAPGSSCFMSTLLGFSIEGILGQCAKAQKINFYHWRWKSTLLPIVSLRINYISSSATMLWSLFALTRRQNYFNLHFWKTTLTQISL